MHGNCGWGSKVGLFLIKIRRRGWQSILSVLPILGRTWYLLQIKKLSNIKIARVFTFQINPWLSIQLNFSSNRTTLWKGQWLFRNISNSQIIFWKLSYCYAYFLLILFLNFHGRRVFLKIRHFCIFWTIRKLLGDFQNIYNLVLLSFSKPRENKLNYISHIWEL